MQLSPCETQFFWIQFQLEIRSRPIVSAASSDFQWDSKCRNYHHQQDFGKKQHELILESVSTFREICLALHIEKIFAWPFVNVAVVFLAHFSQIGVSLVFASSTRLDSKASWWKQLLWKSSKQSSRIEYTQSCCTQGLLQTMEYKTLGANHRHKEQSPLIFCIWARSTHSHPRSWPCFALVFVVDVFQRCGIFCRCRTQ